jgi:hypothetical protein
MLKGQRLRVWAGVLALALIVSVMPADAAGTSSIKGKLTQGDKKQPIVGATVIAYHLSSAKTSRSQPTGSNGRFEILNLESGYYDLAVEYNGLFVGNQVVNAPPDGSAVANMNLLPASQVGAEPRGFAGSDDPAKGIAAFSDGTRSNVVWWGAGGAAALLIIVAGGGSGGSGGSGGTEMMP